MLTDQNQFFRDQLRSARAVALADAEGFQAVFHTLELIGQQLTGQVGDLGRYKDKLSEQANDSPLSADVPSKCPNWHTTFHHLYDELKLARNDSVHQGTHARILTNHAVELTIILEDALMSEACQISQFMVRDVIKAELWHPVSYARQQMLKYSFSYLPVRKDDIWQLIPECSVAQYLRGTSSGNDRKRRLAKCINDAVEAKELRLLKAETATPLAKLTEILHQIREQPILVVDPDHKEVLAGMLSPSDVL